MKRLLNILLLIIPLCLTGCEGTDFDDMLMESYYQESLKLNTCTHDEVQAFGNEFMNVTTEWESAIKTQKGHTKKT